MIGRCDCDNFDRREWICSRVALIREFEGLREAMSEGITIVTSALAEGDVLPVNNAAESIQAWEVILDAMRSLMVDAVQIACEHDPSSSTTATCSGCGRINDQPAEEDVRAV
jgi:hypothetical protein